MVHDELEHQEGSIYCMDWSYNNYLIATGSNDKTVKVIVNPLKHEEDEQLFMEFHGHNNKVRTVCFHTNDDTKLLSGGDRESVIRVWDTQTAENI